MLIRTMLMTKFENNKVHNASLEIADATPSIIKNGKTVFSTFIRGYYVLHITQITDLDAIYYKI